MCALPIWRPAASFPAATGSGLAREGVSGVLRGAQRREGVKGGPGGVCIIDGHGVLRRARDDVHARDRLHVRRGRVLDWAM